MNTNRIRYRQLDYSIDQYRKELGDWDLPNRGCGPTSLAMILANYGIKRDPVEILKKIIVDPNGQFDPTYLAPRGIKPAGLLYCLDRLIKEENMNLTYEIVKVNFEHPEEQYEKIVNNLKNGHMAIVHVGPSIKSKETFSKNGHYLVVSDIDDANQFYVLNPNRIGDHQIGVPFSYDTIICELYGRRESFQFLFIKRKTTDGTKKYPVEKNEKNDKKEE